MKMKMLKYSAVLTMKSQGLNILTRIIGVRELFSLGQS